MPWENTENHIRSGHRDAEEFQKDTLKTIMLNEKEGIKAEAKRLVPVRTGYLRNTIFARIQEWQAEVGAEAAYAANVEFGTRYAMAQPFLDPAVQACLPELERVLVEALNLAKVEVGL